MSPTQRTLKWLRDQGYEADIVERRLPKTFTTLDAFNFGDILAFNHELVLLVQCTSTPNVQQRIKKIKSLKAAFGWAKGPCRQIWAVGWRKYAIPVKRRWWRETVYNIRAEDFLDFSYPPATPSPLPPQVL